MHQLIIAGRSWNALFILACRYYFLKPLIHKKGKILQPGDRAKLNFDHYFEFLTSWGDNNYFLLDTLFFSSSAHRENNFQVFQTDFPFRFCKIGLSKYFLVDKSDKWLFVVLFCCNTLWPDFDFPFLKKGTVFQRSIIRHSEFTE